MGLTIPKSLPGSTLRSRLKRSSNTVLPLKLMNQSRRRIKMAPRKRVRWMFDVKLVLDPGISSVVEQLKVKSPYALEHGDQSTFNIALNWPPAARLAKVKTAVLFDA